MPTLTSVTKHFITAQEGFTTTTAGSVASGAATVTLNSVSGYTNGDQVAFVIDPTDVTKKQVFTGTIDTSGVQVTNVVWTEGTNQTHAAGATVVDYTTATHQAAMVKGVKVSLDQDGTLKAGAVDNSAAIANDVVDSQHYAAGSIDTEHYADGSVTPAKRSGGYAVGLITPSATGSLATTGVGFTPKLVRFTLVSVTSSTVNYGGFGVTDGTNQYATSFYNEQGVDNSGSSASDKCIQAISTNGTVVVDGAFTSFDADGFTLNITTRSAARSFIYEAEA